MKLADVTTDGVVFEQAKSRKAGKVGTGKKICIGWTPELRDVVERAKALSSAGNVVTLSPYLVAGRGRNPVSYSTYWRGFNTATKRAGIKDARPHDLRAKSASDLENEHGGGEQGEAQAQAMLGHSSRTTTRLYLRNRRATRARGPSRGGI